MRIASCKTQQKQYGASDLGERFDGAGKNWIETVAHSERVKRSTGDSSPGRMNSMQNPQPRKSD